MHKELNGIDIYNQRRRLEQRIDLIKESEELPQHAKETILRFGDSCFAEGLSRDRVIHYLQILQRIGIELRRPFEQVSREDILKLVTWLEKSEYSDWTKHDYKVTLKKFFKWMRGGEDYPDEVKWIKTTMKKNHNKLPEELLTEEDIRRLIEAANHPRDKALVSVLYESGCRVSELLSVRVRNVSFDKYGSTLVVSGKSGMRRIRLISSSPYLSTWMNNHPLGDDPDSPLWVGISTTNKNMPLNYAGTRKLLRVLGRRIGLKKALNPHMFRHSRATHLANVLTESQLDQQFGWVQGSNIPSTYVHLSGRDLDRTLLQHYGLEDDQTRQESALKPRKCPRCRQINPPTGKFCNYCGCALNVKTMVDLETEREKADSLMNSLVDDPEVKALLLRKVRELGLDDYMRS